MAKKLPSEADLQFRKLVVDLDGDQQKIAEALGCTQPAVSLRLHADAQWQWWQDFKSRRSLKRKRKSRKAAYERSKARMAKGMQAS